MVLSIFFDDAIIATVTFAVHVVHVAIS